jgi:hypothetical protein
VLSKRNDSESSRFSRLYSEKLKELERTIINLGQIDRMIALREGEIIEGKKNIELVKFKVGSNEGVDDQLMSISNSFLHRKSYSLNKLHSHMQGTRERDFRHDPIMRRLSKR